MYKQGKIARISLSLQVIILSMQSLLRGGEILPMKEKVESVLGKVRPFLQRDGGDVELVDVSDSGVVKVRLKGACSGCPGARITLKQGVERMLKQEIPEVKEVVAV